MVLGFYRPSPGMRNKQFKKKRKKFILEVIQLNSVKSFHVFFVAVVAGVWLWISIRVLENRIISQFPREYAFFSESPDHRQKCFLSPVWNWMLYLLSYGLKIRFSLFVFNNSPDSIISFHKIIWLSLEPGSYMFSCWCFWWITPTLFDLQQWSYISYILYDDNNFKELRSPDHSIWKIIVKYFLVIVISLFNPISLVTVTLLDIPHPTWLIDQVDQCLTLLYSI